MNATTDNIEIETATETVPRMQESEWNAAPITAENVAAILFNRQNPDKVKKPLHPMIYPAFLESVDPAHQGKKYTGTFAKYGAGTLIEFIANAYPPVKLPDATMAELRELDAKIKSLWGQFENFSLSAAQSVWKQQRTAAGTLGADGKLPNITVKSLEDLKNEFLTKQLAIHDNLNPLVARAKELVKPFFKIVFSALAKELVYMEMMERETAARYDVIFVPSHPLRSGWALLVRLDDANLNGQVFPDKMTEALGIGIEL